MPEGSEDHFTLRQIDRARRRPVAIHDELELIKHRLDRLQTGG
jgi:hypothetical protein